jgi:hypothetical protein
MTIPRSFLIVVTSSVVREQYGGFGMNACYRSGRRSVKRNFATESRLNYAHKGFVVFGGSLGGVAIRIPASCTWRSGRRAYPKGRLSTASLLRRTRRVPTQWLRQRRSVARWDARVIADCRWPIADGKLEAKIQLGCARMERATVIEQTAGERMFR